MIESRRRQGPPLSAGPNSLRTGDAASDLAPDRLGDDPPPDPSVGVGGRVGRGRTRPLRSAPRPRLPATLPTASTSSADRKKRAEDARQYNALVQSWSEIMRLAQLPTTPLQGGGVRGGVSWPRSPLPLGESLSRRRRGLGLRVCRDGEPRHGHHVITRSRYAADGGRAGSAVRALRRSTCLMS